jgi:hypothetical protein
VLVLTARFGGKAASVFGSSREWYAPASGLFRVEREVQGARTVSVYNGATIVHAQGGRITRATGEPAFMRIAGRISNSLLIAPAITIVNAYRSGTRIPGLTFHSDDGGRTIDADLRYQGENSPPTDIPIHVVRTGMVDASTAPFQLPQGRVVGEFHQSTPGSHPRFGERGYWFGPHFGRAHAVTTIESWGVGALDALTPAAPNSSPSSPRDAEYETVYRLPLADVNNLRVQDPSIRAPFPGIGEQEPRDIWIECRPDPGAYLPGLLASTPAEKLTLDDGERAKLYVDPYQMGTLDGVTADIVVGHTVCLSRGLISPAQFRALARSLHPA